MRKSQYWITCTIILIFFQNLFAQNYQTEGQFNVRPLVSAFKFSKKRNLKDGDGAGIGLGYYLTHSWSAEFNFMTYSARQRNQTNNKNMHGEYYFVNMLYYFNANSNWQPFVTAGPALFYSNQNFSNQSQHQTQMMVNSGVGIVYYFKKNLGLRLGFNDFYSVSQAGYNDLNANFGVNILIGGHEDEDPREKISPNDACLIESPAPIPSRENNYLAK